MLLRNVLQHVRLQYIQMLQVQSLVPRSHSHCEKKTRHRHVGLQVWQLITRSQFDDWRHIVHHWKGISIALIRCFLKTKTVDTRLQNTNFSIVHLSSQHSVTSLTLGPATTIKREIYNMRHTTSERPKESDILV